MSTRKQINEIKKVQLSIASNSDILKWSSGEVSKPETLNYKTHKPERKGIFDELIFGPVKDYVCPICGKKHKRADAGKPCTSCGETIIDSKMSRRRKMGHIQLATDIVHIWFAKVDYSIVRTVLGLKQEELDSIIYFKSHIVYDNAKLKKIKTNQVIDIQTAYSEYRKILNAIKDVTSDKEKKQIIADKIKSLEEESQTDIAKIYGIDFVEYNDFISDYSDVKIGTGAEVIRELLSRIDLKKEEKAILKDISSKKQTSNIFNRKLKIIEAFKNSKQKLESMVLNVLPVIPADLRPLIQLDGGRHSTVDINELYRRVIIRNNRLKVWIEMQAPALIVQNEKRMLQEAVDALFDNSRRRTPLLSKDNRPLKSLAENLKGKQGRFRQNLLGKRVDYSGRTVIVVGPDLKLHQVGIPKQMIVKLFEPFIVKMLVEDKVVKNIKQAKKMIELMDDRIWKYATKVIKNHPVLLNRAPTLHRLSIQAFEPVITSGKAIRLHPLVTSAFNADFDGDQMAVHVPLSKKAKEEAWNLMTSAKNVLGPKDGKLVLLPSQDVVLGMYHLTKVDIKAVGSKRVFSSLDEIENNLTLHNVDTKSVIIVPLTMFEDKFKVELGQGYKYLVTSVGRILLNSKISSAIPYFNDVSDASFLATPSKYLLKSIEEKDKGFETFITSVKPMKKAQIVSIIEAVYEKDPSNIAVVLDDIKDLGFLYSMYSGASMAITDIVEVKKREEIIKDGDKKVAKLEKLFEEGLITDDQRYLQVLKVWAEVREEIKNELQITIEQHKDNSLYMMMDSGARGNISNFVQLAGMRGSMSKATHEYAALRRQGILVRTIEEIPVKSSFKIGLNPFEYFLSTNGARKGLSDTATKTAESGYLTRRLVDAVQDVMITEDDCFTNKGFVVKEIIDTRTRSTISNLYERIVGRYATSDVKSGNKVIVEGGELITPILAKTIVEANIDNVEIRSVLTCNSHRGICKKCYGLDLTTGNKVNTGEAVGIIAAQSIGEPGTQLTMRTFHTGGVAGVADITQGFARLMELVDANKNPKSASEISEIEGEIQSIEITKVREDGSPHEMSIKVKGKNETKEYEKVNASHLLRVKVGDKVYPGSKITEGSITLQKLLQVAGKTQVESYLIKEMQRLYKIQGINIADKYMEVIIRQMLSKVKIINSGQTDLYVSQIVSKDKLREVNLIAMKNGKAPAFGENLIIGVKPLPLQSESFLAAASYQRTAEALVNAAITKKIDELYGVKENLIIGKKIPVGTGKISPEGKYILHESDGFENEYYKSLENSRKSSFDGNEEHQEEIRVVNDNSSLHELEELVDPNFGNEEE